MTEPQWRYWTPERDGHAPDDWDGNGVEIFFGGFWDAVRKQPCWHLGERYRYRPLQDATVDDASGDVAKWTFDTLKAQCLALPEEERSALVEALQKPVRDWADDLADEVWSEYEENMGAATKVIAARIRSKCRLKIDESDAKDLFFKIIETSRYDLRVREDGLDDLDLEAIRLIREALS